MPGTEYKVIEAKKLEIFRQEVIHEGERGWRVISMAVGPRGYFYAVMEKKTGVLADAA
jgi:hypothetical protein